MRKGQILIVILIIFVILSIVAITLITMLEGNLSSVQSQKGEKQALYVAEAGIERVIYTLRYTTFTFTYTVMTGIISATSFVGYYTTTLKWEPTYSQFEIISTGAVREWRRGLRVEGSKDSTGSLIITLWQEE